MRVVKWLDDEADSIRAVLAHCLNGPDRAIGMAMVGALGWYWAPRATSEGMYWLDRYLEHREDDADAVAHALFARGFVATVLGDGVAAQALLMEAEASARAVDDLGLLVRILAISSRVRAMSGDLAGARSQVVDAEAVARGVDDQAADAALNQTQGFIALAAGDLEASRRIYEESAARTRDRGDLHSLIYVLGYYGFSLLQHSQPDAARTLLVESLVISQQLDNRDAMLYHLYGVAFCDAMAGHHRRAARVLSAAETMNIESGARLISMMEPLLCQARQTLWCRVSSESQETENQAIALREWAARRGLDVTREYRVEASAWHGAQHPALKEAVNDGRLGHFDVLLCWSIDRLSRGGVEETLGILRRLRESGVSVESLQENWITGSPDMAELMTSILAWVARMESERRSERVRAGLARRKAAGLPVGRLPGAKDLRPRRRSGYVARYERERA